MNKKRKIDDCMSVNIPFISDFIDTFSVVLLMNCSKTLFNIIAKNTSVWKHRDVCIDPSKLQILPRFSFGNVTIDYGNGAFERERIVEFFKTQTKLRKLTVLSPISIGDIQEYLMKCPLRSVNFSGVLNLNLRFIRKMKKPIKKLVINQDVYNERIIAPCLEILILKSFTHQVFNEMLASLLPPSITALKLVNFKFKQSATTVIYQQCPQLIKFKKVQCTFIDT